MNVKRRYRLISAKLEFVKKELEITKDIFVDAKMEFSEDFKKRVEIVDDHPPQEQNKEEQEESQISNHRRETKQDISDEDIEKHIKEEKDEELKKVFKKIARKTHPDLLYNKSAFERGKKEALFRNAKLAIEEEDFFELSKIAKELGIEPPQPTKKHVKMMEKTVEKISGEIKTIKGTVAWVWYHEDDEERRLAFMKKYIDALKNK